MAINKKRAREFAGNIQDLMNELQFGEFYETFRAKMFDVIAKRELDVESLRSAIRKIKRIFDPEFAKYIDLVFSDYNEAVNLINQHYDDIGGDISRNFDKIQAIEKVNLSRLGDYSKAATREISKKVRKGILEGKTSGEIAKALADTDDKVKFFADTIARTQVKGYSNALKLEKSRLGEVFFMTYFGFVRSNSRVFCRALLEETDPTFHVNDISQMRNGQIEPVRVYRGGYNCNHDWEPDPFFKKEDYNVSFYTVQVGKRSLKLARRRMK